MRTVTRVLFAAMLITTGLASGQAKGKDPHIGYVYPAGGQQGTTVQILVGGQGVQGITDVRVTGEGVDASVLKCYRPLKNLDENERKELRRRIIYLWEKRWTELKGEGNTPPLPALGFPGKPTGKQGVLQRAAAAIGVGTVELPSHPVLDNLDNMSIRGLASVFQEIADVKKRQRNAQIAEMVLIEIRVAPTATTGDRELRLKGPNGLTNPMCFQVGDCPEAREQEPNDPKVSIPLPEEPPLSVPVTVNGQVMPGDVDRFEFRAQKGQELVLQAQARHLVPYLADAVPGWFQATTTIFDGDGKEVAFNDDYGFDPDPVIFWQVPVDGVYTLEVRDSIYRGREDFVYRVTIGGQPFITVMSPLGSEAGKKCKATVSGWNLPKKRLLLDTEPDGAHVRLARFEQEGIVSNFVPYVVDTLPDRNEKEPNNSPEDPQRLKMPGMVNGCIDEPGDEDVYRFEGRAEETVVTEIYGRRLRSQIDSLLRLTDASGKEIASNDDCEDKECGLLTHHADSYLCAKLPSDGPYFVHVTDAQHQGSESCGYRLRVSPPQPGFALRATPSSINVLPLRASLLTVHALRKEGFDGDIEVALKNAPDGLTLSGGRIPAGIDNARMTLSFSGELTGQEAEIQLEGRGQINGNTVRIPVVPAEDMMQAFAYRHLVPSQKLVVLIRGKKGKAPLIRINEALPLRIPAGGSAQASVKIPKFMKERGIELELVDPPAGITLQDTSVANQLLTFTLHADKQALKPGYANNLIVGVLLGPEPSKQTPDASAQPAAPGQIVPRNPAGLLPAIPVEITE